MSRLSGGSWGAVWSAKRHRIMCSWNTNTYKWQIIRISSKKKKKCFFCPPFNSHWKKGRERIPFLRVDAASVQGHGAAACSWHWTPTSHTISLLIRRQAICRRTIVLILTTRVRQNSRVSLENNAAFYFSCEFDGRGWTAAQFLQTHLTLKRWPM